MTVCSFFNTFGIKEETKQDYMNWEKARQGNVYDCFMGQLT